MAPRRIRKFPLFLAGLYFLWSCLVYFGTLPGEAHSWWPIFLYPLIWPLGVLLQHFDYAFLHWLAPDFRAAPASVFILNDRLLGAFYILAGTAWYWLIGQVLSFLARPISAWIDGVETPPAGEE